MSKIKINPLTKDIEIEVSEQFLLKYLGGFGMLLKAPKKIKVTSAEKKPRVKKVAIKKTKVEKVANVERAAKVVKANTKKTKSPKRNIQQTILDAIKESQDSISTAEIIKKTKLANGQVYSVTGKLKKAGIIKSVKKGFFELVKAE